MQQKIQTSATMNTPLDFVMVPPSTPTSRNPRNYSTRPKFQCHHSTKITTPGKHSKLDNHFNSFHVTGFFFIGKNKQSKRK